MFTERLDVTGYEEVYHFTDTDFSAFIAIHNTQLGPALGGWLKVIYPALWRGR